MPLLHVQASGKTSPSQNLDELSMDLRPPRRRLRPLQDQPEDPNSRLIAEDYMMDL